MSEKPSINKCRKTIDQIDEKLLTLLNDRAKEAQKIGRIKAKSHEEVFSSGRERQILDRLIERNKGPLQDEALEDIFQTVFTSCRSLQKRLSIAFLGPEATFTHQVAVKHFGRNCDYTAVPSIKDVFSEVERKRADFGVVPIENSTEGVVNHTLDMFMDSDLLIVAEKEELISQNIFSISGDIKAVKTVYSHAQALSQCRKWLDTHLPGISVHDSASTADAALQATLDNSVAAIASMAAGQSYNLKPIALKIEDSPDNATRFLVIGRKMQSPTKKNKTSILFSLKDKVGALHEMLEPFRKEKLNLTKIESRPTKKKAWEYIFFVDFVGHIQDPNTKRALSALKKKCTTLRVLGSYPCGD
jgi:chorismate mutase/prephenate dehydratase